MIRTPHRGAARCAALAIAFAAALGAAGCGTGPLGMGTGYQPQGWTGGYDETQLAPNVFRVGFIANQYTLPSTATDFALLRAAELTLDRGFSHFAVVRGVDSVATTQVTTPVTRTQTDVFAGQIRQREVTVGERSYTSAVPSSSNTIVCFHGAPANPPYLVMDARQIYDQLVAKHKIKSRFAGAA